MTVVWRHKTSEVLDANWGGVDSSQVLGLLHLDFLFAFLTISDNWKLLIFTYPLLIHFLIAFKNLVILIVILIVKDLLSVIWDL